MARPQDARPLTHDDLLQFVERFALLLTSSGLPRMPARVFAYVMAEDAERYTARELAEGLRVSPAAISGALKVLVQAGILARDRTPESAVTTIASSTTTFGWRSAARDSNCSVAGTMPSRRGSSYSDGIERVVAA